GSACACRRTRRRRRSSASWKNSAGGIGVFHQIREVFFRPSLGEDSFERKIKDLIPEGDSWGAYFSFDEGDAEQDEVDRMEHLIITAQQWLDSEENFET
ncbi:hypothetical protein RXP19_31770, partial [Pseudomonas aeruginosa]|nr:hypothetical protein [Pseudomonas aeruginosa]MEB5097811.1 hypothetical protein [Pseudomonas aeruginosa]MEB5109817.1 hypothetical protein [Pseudomonas aeruginosa]MEB5161892.1 hypothetical protein [Pseudomonas aeruginosa]MEB5173753.1 hypothetical protein [Pseudomonas aeruginosa]